MTFLFRFCLVLATAAVSLLIAAASAGLAAEAQPVESDDAWVASMKAVHEKFKGQRGTFAQFGDSITVSRAGEGLHAGGLLGLEGAGIRQSGADDHPLGPSERGQLAR